MIAVDCPLQVSEQAGGPVRPVRTHVTAESVITICADEFGGLYYHRSSSAGEIVLRADQIDGGTYVATSQVDGSTFVYRVNDHELIVEENGFVLVRQPVTSSG